MTEPPAFDIDFWKATFLATLGEMIRVEGRSALLHAPETVHLCKTAATLAAGALAAATTSGPPGPCPSCQGIRFVFREGDEVGRPCPACNAEHAPVPLLSTEAAAAREGA